MGDAFFSLEELQAVAAELPAEHIDDFQRKAPLVIEFVADEVLHSRRGFFAENSRLKSDIVHAGDHVGQMVLPEMFADRRARLEPGLLRQVDSDVLGLPALLVEPLLHDLLVMNDFHARLEDVERQPGKTVRVQGTKLVLIAVIVRRPENLVAHAALRHEGVGALGRLDLDFIGLVKRVEMPAQHMVHCLILREPNRLVHLAEKQRLGDGAVLLLLGLENDEVALRLGENQPRDVEQRIGPAGVLNLPGDRLDAVFLRLNGHVQFQRRALRHLAAPKVLPFVEGPFAVVLLKFWTPVAIAVAIPVAAAVVVAPSGWPVAPVAASARTGPLFAGVVGIRFCVIRFLRPSGEKLQVQIQLLQRIGVFGFTHCGWISVISGWLRLMTGGRK